MSGKRNGKKGVVMPEQGLTQDNAQSGNLENQEAQGQQQGQQEQTNQATQQQIDWENENNPYRKRYTDSQSQVQPLVRTLQQFAEYDHTTKTWKPKTQTVSQPQGGDVDFEKILEGYDPDFRKALSGFTRKQVNDAIAEYKKESAFLSEYNSGVQESRSKAISEYGSEYNFAKDGKMNTASPLYQMANEIILNKYAIFNPDGTFQKYNNAEAEYLATTEAYAILTKRSKQQPQGKEKFNAIKGQGTGSAAVKRSLTYAEYSKLSEAEKDAYDLSQIGG